MARTYTEKKEEKKTGRRGSIFLENSETNVEFDEIIGPGGTFGSLAKRNTSHMLVTTIPTPGGDDTTEVIIVQKDVYRQDKRWQNIYIMKNNPLLAKWSRLRVEALVDVLEPRAYNRGATIYEQGDDGDVPSGQTGLFQGAST